MVSGVDRNIIQTIVFKKQKKHVKIYVDEQIKITLFCESRRWDFSKMGGWDEEGGKEYSRGDEGHPLG